MLPIIGYAFLLSPFVLFPLAQRLHLSPLLVPGIYLTLWAAWEVYLHLARPGPVATRRSLLDCARADHSPRSRNQAAQGEEPKPLMAECHPPPIIQPLPLIFGGRPGPLRIRVFDPGGLPGPRRPRLRRPFLAFFLGLVLARSPWIVS